MYFSCSAMHMQPLAVVLGMVEFPVALHLADKSVMMAP
jgi:hypothetical protein